MISPIKIQTTDYSILLGNAGLLLDEFISKGNYSSLFVLMDEHTYTLCYPILSNESTLLENADLLVIDPGEANKSIEIAAHLWESLTESGADRHSLLINLGGGLITDLGGFVASTFKRGMDFVNIPTSLLAMVDASIGGKTGVNLSKYKNQVGLFATPKQLIIDVQFLETLHENQKVSAYAEMLKHGLILDANYWTKLSKLEDFTSENLQELIQQSILIKKEIVEQDPTEKGLRKVLNFGHTIGHAFESYFLDTESPLLHGEAVAIGILVEAQLSHDILGLSLEELHEIQEVIKKHFKAISFAENQIPEIIAFSKQDKKKEGTRLNFSLLNRIGDCQINVDITEEKIENSLKQVIHGFFNNKKESKHKR
ncbi:MAG: 3-dehydroquinate synthase [Bacteroidales bacterium]|nr:3-dehydroquinate synthase [Bacteroidales bacterium]